MSRGVRRLTESTLVSLDGVIESPEGWATFDDESTEDSLKELEGYDGFVMGRVTFEQVFANWASVSGNPYLDRINTMPKYVGSRSLADVGGEAILLGPEVVDAIERLKAEPGKDLMKSAPADSTARSYRRGWWTRSVFWFVPVVVGKGRRLFGGVDIRSVVFELTDVRRFENGSVLHTYVPDQ